MKIINNKPVIKYTTFVSVMMGSAMLHPSYGDEHVGWVK